MAEQGIVHLFPKGAGEAPAVEPQLRALEAILFASSEPVSEAELQGRLPEGSNCSELLGALEQLYADRGVNLTKVAKGWAFRTSPDLAHLMAREVVEQRRLSRAAQEMLAIIAYHQPVTRTEIEEIRGVATSRGTLDLLIEIGWVRICGRRQAPGRPVTYGTNDAFLEHFSLDRVSDLPGIDELAASGLLEKTVAPVLQRDDDETPADDEGDDEKLDPIYLDTDIEAEAGG